jgi:uncharacterized iron-regulated membrane protein
MHLAAGVAAGSVIFIMCVTGALLAYEAQIVAWAEGGYRSIPPAHGQRRSAASLLEAVCESGLLPTAITVRSDPESPATVSLGRERSVFVDVYSGKILGEGSPSVRRFFRVVTDWHRWLGAGEKRAFWREVTGASNLAFFFLVASGLYLWWPRSLRAWRGSFWFLGGLRGRARDFNWHNVIGFWCNLPLALVVFSAVFISYPRANDLLYRLTGDEPPPRQAPSSSSARRDPDAEPLSLEGLEESWTRAEAMAPPGWRSITLRLPESGGEPWRFTIEAGGRGRPDLRSQVVVERGSPGSVRMETYASLAPARKIRSWLRFLHTGEALGWPGQTVAAAVSIGGGFLVFTGLSLALRRFLARSSRGKRGD